MGGMLSLPGASPFASSVGAGGLKSVGSSAGIAVPESQSPTISQEQMTEMSDRAFNTVNPGFNLKVSRTEAAARSLAGVGITLADNVWSSPLNPVGWVSDVNAPGNVWSLASQEEQDYYNQNRGGIDAAAGVVGALATVVVGDKMVMKGVKTALAGSTSIGVTKAFQFSATWETKAHVAVLEAQRAAAVSGERFSMMGTAAGRNYLGAKVANQSVEVLRQEALTYGVMWNNDTINQEGWTDDAFWMGVGLGLGGATAVIQARGVLRKSMNSSETKTALGAMYPMAGTSDALTRDIAPIADINKVVPRGRVNELSADFTQFAVAARAGGGLDVPGRVKATQDQLRAVAKTEAEMTLQKIVVSGVDGVKADKSAAKGSPALRHLMDTTAKQDPNVLHGMAEGTFIANGTSIESAVKSRKVHLAEAAATAEAMTKSQKASEGRALASKVARQRKQEPMVLVNGSWLAVDSPLAKAATSFNQAVAKARVVFTPEVTEVSINLPTGKSFVIDGTLAVRSTTSAGVGHVGKKVNYASLAPDQRLYVQEGMNKMVSELAKPGQKVAFKVTPRNENDWMTLDIADEVISRGGTVNFDSKSLVKDHEGIKRASIRAKASAALAEVGPYGVIDDEIRAKYNLPSPTAMERLEDPDGNIIRAWLDMAIQPTGTVRELSAALNEARAVGGVDLRPLDGMTPSKLTGDMIGWNRDKDGNFLQPMLGYFNPSSQIETLSRMGHEEAAMAREIEKMAILTDRTKGGMVNELARELVSNPATNQARKVNQLHDGQQTGLGSRIKQAVSEFLPGGFLSRDNPIILAASRLLEHTMRKADMAFIGMMKATGLEEVAKAIDSPARAAMAAQLDEFMSLRSGWDIDSVAEIEPGWFGFTLADTAVNRELLGVQSVPKGELMPNRRLNKPIVMQTQALETLQKTMALFEEIRKGSNTIRAARGLNPIQKKFLFAPSQETKGRFIGFVFDENDRIVKGQTINAGSEAEYEAEVARRIGSLTRDADLPNGYTVRSQKELSNTKSIWDREALDWIDHGQSSATKGIGQQSGGLTGPYTKPGAYKESLSWAKKQVRQQAKETLEAVMSEPMRLAKMRNIAAKNADPSLNRTVFDVWEHSLTGNSAGYRETAVLSPVFDAAAQSIDKVLSSSAIHVPLSHVLDISRRFGVSPVKASQARTYRQITEIMGDKSPYSSVTEFLESQNVRMPTTTAKIARQLNGLATNVVLRWDPLMAHASMNMLGLIPTMLSGVRAGSAPNAMSMAIQGRRVGFIDSLAIVRSGLRDMVGKTKHPDWQWMVAHGDASQSAFEYRSALAAIEDQSGFHKWSHRIDEWVSKASDGSENLSRQTSHFVGLRLADAQGIKGMEARHNFAREFANAAIADYNPANRPELFNTALGSVFGLFQSYVTSQYTKMFKWIEDGQWAAFGTQAVVQASLFGVPSSYGVGTLFDMDAARSETGEPSLMDAAYQRFGPVVGGALMHGGIAELSQIALWTRGDINLRIPALSGQLPAGVDVIKRFGTMFTGVVSEALNQGPIDALPAMVEIVQREMPNRMLKGIMAVTLLDGKETDRYGQVMSETHAWTMDVVARVAGVRSRRAQQELEVFYANKSDIDRDAARMDRVRRRLRTDVRSAASDSTLINPDDYFEDYVAAGGTPHRYRSWLKQILSDATTTRAAAQLKKSIEKPQNNLALWRYGAYGAWGIDDGSTPEK